MEIISSERSALSEDLFMAGGKAIQFDSGAGQPNLLAIIPPRVCLMRDFDKCDMGTPRTPVTYTASNKQQNEGKEFVVGHHPYNDFEGISYKNLV